MTKFLVKAAAMPTVPPLQTTVNFKLQRDHGWRSNFVATKFYASPSYDEPRRR
jgi:hypothetical protein